MQTHQVQRDGESLVARLVENGERSIELTYRNSRGDTQVGIYRNGLEVSTKVTLVDKEYPYKGNRGNYLTGYLAAYNRLGPELREQIPSDWHAVLGKWLAPKEE